MKKMFLLNILFFSGTLLHAQISNGLLAYYPFNGNSNDESGKGHNGTVFGATLTLDRFGKENSAYYFDGDNHYISCSNDGELLTGKTFSVSAWFKIKNRVNGWQQNIIVANIGNFGSSGGFELIMPNAPGSYTGMFRNTTFTDQESTGTITIQPDKWYNYIFIVKYINNTNNTETYNYINGVLDNTHSFPGSISWSNISPFYIGINIDGFTGWQRAFKGSIDEVRIYNRALTQAEINTLAKDFPLASIADKALNEGNSGTSIMKFKVTLDHSSSETIKIKYRTADMTAIAGNDYVATQGTLTFQPGQTSKYISVTINGDTRNESNEKFKVLLSNPSNVLLADKTGVGTIKNDDASMVEVRNELATDLSVGAPITLSPNPATNYIRFSGV
ncbi:MAG: LamG-like jellyroll fold domain-containing protein, partial [Ilyomonas sp.]